MGRRLLRLDVICQIGSGWETIGLGSASGCDGNAVQRDLVSGLPDIIESRDSLFLGSPDSPQSMLRAGHGATQRTFAQAIESASRRAPVGATACRSTRTICNSPSSFPSRRAEPALPRSWGRRSCGALAPGPVAALVVVATKRKP